ncbi:MAG: type II toxin-antitoxin system HicB family antitoxin [Terriglobales bacterium]
MDSTPKRGQTLTIEFDREEDGRWIAEVPELPGVLAYGDSKEDAALRVQALAFQCGVATGSRGSATLERE